MSFFNIIKEYIDSKFEEKYKIIETTQNILNQNVENVNKINIEENECKIKFIRELLETKLHKLEIENECKIKFIGESFEVQLREKIMSNEAQLITSFNKMEQKCNHLSHRIDELQETLEQCQSKNRLMIETLSYSEIYLGHYSRGFNLYNVMNVPLNVTYIEILNYFDKFNTSTLISRRNCMNIIYWNKFKFLFNLKKIKFSNIDIDFQIFLSESLEEIEIIGAETCSLSGIEKNKKIKKITLNGLNNLSHANFMPYIKECKNLKHLIITMCVHINILEIQTYCQTNQIQIIS
jgi:hypothetical protein